MATISVDDMRPMISKVYPGDAWKQKVRHMSDKQVCAIYFSFLEQGKFEKKKPQTYLCMYCGAETTNPAWDHVCDECAENFDEPCTDDCEPRTDVFAVDTAEQMSFEL